MNWAPWFDELRCRTCGTIAPRSAIECDDCGGPLRAFPPADIDLSSLPVSNQFLPVSAAFHQSRPGQTPIIESEWLASEAGVAKVLLKDEGRNPTGHVSDRGMAVATAAATLLNVQTIGLASPGRTGVAASAAAASSGLSSEIYVPARAPFPVKAMINVHGGEMTVVGGRYADALAAYVEGGQSDTQWTVDPYLNAYARAGRETIYFELLSQVPNGTPDVLVVPTGTGASAVALADAATTCFEAGIISTMPRLVIAQPEGCAPIVDGFSSSTDAISPVEQPDTICGELEIPDPTGGTAVLEAIEHTGGEAIAVPDPAALEAAVRLAQRDGVSASVAAGVAAAATTDMTVAQPDDKVAVINPGAGGLDADVLRSHLMGQGI